MAGKFGKVALAAFGWLWLAAAASAQQPAAMVLADSIFVSANGQVLIAEGNVQVTFEGIVLNAASIAYDAVNDSISATGPLVLTDGDGTRIFADLAMLSADMQRGIIQGAKVLLANNFQIAAAEARRDSDRYTILYKTVGSSCEVCFDNPVPIWRIRSARIIHDRLEKTLYFEDASFDVFGLTILYLPLLRTPAPGVARASGFLVPEFQSSDALGYGVQVPYYLVIGPQSDTTLTPIVTSGGALVLEGEYRSWFPTGSLVLAGAIAFRDGLGSESWRGYGSARGRFALGDRFTGQFDTIATSDDAFLRLFDYSKDDRLISAASVTRYREVDFLEIGAVVFQSLRDDEDNSTIPVVFPEIEFRRHLPSDLIGGQLAVGANMVGLTRSSGRDVYRLGLNTDWRRNWTFSNGLLAGAFVQADWNFYRIFDDPGFEEVTYSYLSPSAGVELRWPLARQNGAVLHVIEPVAQLIFTGNPAGNDVVPNEDSQQVEFDETNLFAFNRYPGLDRFETGLRANIGATYNRYDPSGWNVGVTIGQVIRARNDSPFSEGSGLGTQVSDLVGAVSLELPPGFRMVNRVLFDDTLDFKRAESQVWLDTDAYSFNASYLHLDADANAGAPDARNEIAFGARWRFRPNWEITGSARYNMTAATPIEADGGLTFANECVRVDLSVSRSYTSSDNVPPATNYGLTISLAGFGGNSEDRWPSQGCGLN